MSNPRVTGAIRYAQDVEFEGMLYASILRSPHPHARILRVDASAVPDSVVVLTPDDIRELGMYGCQIKDQTVLAADRARFAGDPAVDWAKAMGGYNYVDALNGKGAFAGVQSPLTLASRYGLPQVFQGARNIRLAVRFTF